MYKRLILNDLKSSKISSATIFLFILITSLLLSSISIFTFYLFNSINNLMDEAKAPHFIEMHLGEVDFKKIDDFAQTHEEVKSHQVLPFVNVDSSDIRVDGNLFTDSSQDNGFTHQSENFDYLLDFNNEIAKPNPGEVYVPLSYYLNNKIKEGQIISVGDLELEVMGAIRDVQMNSTLSSSKRFLVHPDDLEKIKTLGKTEYLIEFLLNDLDYLSSFQGVFANSLDYNNGPTITYPLIKLINGLTEGIKLLLIFLIFLMTLFISFLCIRFCILTNMKKEKLEIGILKGIGITVKNIKSLYLSKYLLIASSGSILGFLCSLLFSNLLMRNIRNYFGASLNNFAFVLGFISSLFVMALVIFYIDKLLHRFKKISPVDAINGIDESSKKNIKVSLKSKFINSSKNYLSILNLLNRKKLYFTFSLIIILTTFIISMPLEIYNSFNSKNFIQYMGIGDVDIIMSKQESLDDGERNNITNFLDNEKIYSYSIITQKSQSFEVDGNTTKLWVNYGNHETFPINYSLGDVAKNENEIAISYLSAEELGKNIGDEINLISDEKIIPLKIVGIYSDITNGGMTAQMNEDLENSDALRTTIYIKLEDSNENQIISKIANNFNGYKILNVEDYREEVLGSTINNLNQISKISIIIGLFIILLITILFNNLIVVEDRKNTSMLKALGFVSEKITYKYFFAAILVSIFSIIIGLILSRLIGEVLTSMFMQNLGVGSFKFTKAGLLRALIIFPVILILIYISTKISVREVSKTDVSDYIRE